MVDKIEKFIRRLGRGRAADVRAAVVKILMDDVTGLDVKKLKGVRAEYRVRIGKIRIKFVRAGIGNTIVDIDFRGDNTY